MVRKTTRERPLQATHWSTRTLAAELGISPASVRRIWKRHGLKPHLVRTFKVSNDPHFAEKLEDIVGLYLNPPEHALVFSVDEKSQIQALDRTQPGLPIKKGRAGTMTHDYNWRLLRRTWSGSRASQDRGPLASLRLAYISYGKCGARAVLCEPIFM